MKKQKYLELLIFIKLSILVFLTVFGMFIFLKSVGAIILFSTNIWENYGLEEITKHDLIYNYFFAVLGLVIFILALLLLLEKKKQLKDDISRKGMHLVK